MLWRQTGVLYLLQQRLTTRYPQGFAAAPQHQLVELLLGLVVDGRERWRKGFSTEFLADTAQQLARRCDKSATTTGNDRRSGIRPCQPRRQRRIQTPALRILAPFDGVTKAADPKPGMLRLQAVQLFSEAKAVGLFLPIQ